LSDTLVKSYSRWQNENEQLISACSGGKAVGAWSWPLTSI